VQATPALESFGGESDAVETCHPGSVGIGRSISESRPSGFKEGLGEGKRMATRTPLAPLQLPHTFCSIPADAGPLVQFQLTRGLRFDSS
jgi:hypothetical protein